ncbi:hypothetical protein AMECASPLE_024209 [Ameca splendens]|uniref:Uncharacterized protein n=1 Tax=Ameca splendens TaxID=208324 RepID=A0ABV0XT79_9TELE
MSSSYQAPLFPLSSFPVFLTFYVVFSVLPFLEQFYHFFLPISLLCSPLLSSPLHPACLSSLSVLSVCAGMSLAGSAPACPHFMLIGPAVPLKFTMATTTCRLATPLFSLIPAIILHRQRESEKEKKRLKIPSDLSVYVCVCVCVCVCVSYTWKCLASVL